MYFVCIFSFFVLNQCKMLVASGEKQAGTGSRLMVDDGLAFSEHIHKSANKAKGIMAVIRRTFTCLDCKCFSKRCL